MPVEPTEQDDVADRSERGTTPDLDDQPAVLAPGDSDAPDVPDADTVYPDRPGVPGEPNE